MSELEAAIQALLALDQALDNYKRALLSIETSARDDLDNLGEGFAPRGLSFQQTGQIHEHKVRYDLAVAAAHRNPIARARIQDVHEGFDLWAWIVATRKAAA